MAAARGESHNSLIIKQLRVNPIKKNKNAFFMQKVLVIFAVLCIMVTSKEGRVKPPKTPQSSEWRAKKITFL
jgi:hypothetical protein